MLSLPLRFARLTIGLVLLVALGSLVALGVIVQVAPRLGWAPYVIHGASMEPTIPLGSLVLVARADPASIAVGDVISVRTDAGPVYTHRVVAVVRSTQGLAFQTRGDANATPDPEVAPARAVEGRVAAQMPIAGFVVAMVGLRSGLLCVATLLGALLLLYWLLEDLEPSRSRRPRPNRPAPRSALP
jgi:signal peptidase